MGLKTTFFALTLEKIDWFTGNLKAFKEKSLFLRV